MGTQATEASGLLQAQARIFHDELGHAFSMSLACAMELNIPGVMEAHGRPITLPELLSQLSIPAANASFLGRIMRLLVHKGYFVHERSTETYSLTPLSKLLVNDSPVSLAYYFLAHTMEDSLAPWHLLAAFCRLDHQKHYTTPCEMKYGKPVWELMKETPEFNEILNMAMASDSSVSVKAMMAHCANAFEGVKSLVDVGGGNGTVLRGISEAFPNIKCILFDLPHVIHSLPDTSDIEFFAGDMFEGVPSADVVLLHLVLHDWSDENCVKILNQCKEAISKNNSGGKVMIVDIVMDLNNADSITTETQLYYDINMLVCAEGKEREEHEWMKIIKGAGFTSYKITPLGFRSLIEVFP